MSKSYAELAPQFAKVRAQILQILNKHPEGLTTQQVSKFYLYEHGYLPRIGNRLRELCSKKYEELVERKVVNGKIRFFVVLEEGLVNHQSSEVP